MYTENYAQLMFVRLTKEVIFNKCWVIYVDDKVNGING